MAATCWYSFFNRFAHKPFCVHRFLPDRNSLTCHDQFFIGRLFFHAALISAVFIRQPPALLVAPRNFAPRIFVSLHCFLLRRPSARPAGLSAFRSDRFCSPGVWRREQSRSFMYVDRHILEGMLSTQKCEVDHARADFTGIANSTTQHF